MGDAKETVCIHKTLFIYNNKSNHNKKTWKKINEKRVVHFFKMEKVNSFFDSTSISYKKNINPIVKSFCKQHSNTTSDKLVAFLFDTNVLLTKDLGLVLPTFPTDAQILFLEADILKYENDNEDEDEQTDWVKCTVSSSGHFIVLSKYLPKFCEIFLKCDTISKVWEKMSEMNTYVICGHPLSEMITNYTVPDPALKISPKNQELLISYKTKKEISYKKGTCQLLNEKKISMFSDFEFANIEDSNLPKISFVSYYTADDELFFNVILTFLKCEYPYSLKELTIVNDTEINDIPGLPEDSRIQIVRVKSKDQQTQIHATTGCKLNIAVQQSKNKIIQHLIPGTILGDLNFKNKIKVFLSSQSQNKMCVFDKNKDAECPHLGSLMYTKSFWFKNNFEESNLMESNGILYNFIKYRTSLCTTRISPNFVISDEIENELIIPENFSEFSKKWLIGYLGQLQLQTQTQKKNSN